MKRQEIKELKNKPLAELEGMRREHAERLRRLMLDLAAGKVKNVGEVRVVRKDLARINTFITMARRSG